MRYSYQDILPQMNPLVSVAIITYNQKSYLQECIDSVISQSYSNIEIIVADDGSTDGTVELLHEYLDKLKIDIKFVCNEKNQGITHNSNAALAMCSGKYIAWMGGDDLMMPFKIAKQVAYMESNPDCSICYHDLDVFDSDSNRTLYLYSEKSKPREGGVTVVIENETFNGACSCMVRASKSPSSGFNGLVPFASDWLYWVEILHNGGTINYIPEVLGRYRRHASNITNATSKIQQNDIDHFNSCSYIMALDSKYAKCAIKAYSNRLLNIRKKTEYLVVVGYSLKIKFSLKGFVCFIVYACTFGNVKI